MGAVVVVVLLAAASLSLVAVARRAPALRVVVIEGVVGRRAVRHVVLPLVGVGQQLLLWVAVRIEFFLCCGASPFIRTLQLKKKKQLFIFLFMNNGKIKNT